MCLKVVSEYQAPWRKTLKTSKYALSERVSAMDSYILSYHQPIVNRFPGMGGLTSALALAKKGFNDIQVFESASSLGFVGAGSQLAPNMARILDRLGVWPEIEKEAVKVMNTSIRRK